MLKYKNNNKKAIKLWLHSSNREYSNLRMDLFRCSFTFRCIIIIVFIVVGTLVADAKEKKGRSNKIFMFNIQNHHIEKSNYGL